jgi:hypothetical protein
MKCSKQLSATMPWGEHKLLSGSNINSKFVTFFFDYDGIVHPAFVPPGQTVNQHYYLVWKSLSEQVR